MKLRIKYADQIVGTFVIAAMIFVAALSILLGLNQRWFATNHYFHSEFGSAAGLSSGTPITLKGFEIGKIETITLNAKNTIDVKFYVYEDYIKKVTKNSILEMVSSPIGIGGGLVMHVGYAEELAEPESMIPSYDSPEAQEFIANDLVNIPLRDDAITRLLGNVNRLLESVNRTVTLLNQAIDGRGGGELKGIVSGAKNTIEQLASVMGQVNVLMADNTGNITNSLTEVETLLVSVNKVVENLDQITANLEGTTASIKDPTGLVPKLLGDAVPLDKLYGQIDELMVTVNKLAQDMQSAVAGISNEVPKISSLLLETRQAVKQAQDVLEGVRNNPLLSGGISPKPVQETRLESLRREEF